MVNVSKSCSHIMAQSRTSDLSSLAPCETQVITDLGVTVDPSMKLSWGDGAHAAHPVWNQSHLHCTITTGSKAAAWFWSGTGKMERITPVLASLHWLTVHYFWICFSNRFVYFKISYLQKGAIIKNLVQSKGQFQSMR